VSHHCRGQQSTGEGPVLGEAHAVSEGEELCEEGELPVLTVAARTGQDRTRQNRTEQNRTRQDKTGQDRTGQDRTGQDRTGQDRTGRDRTVVNTLFSIL
jgi:hypothetical protein